jgi:uncharacterized protein (DUF849 family)
MVYILDDYAYEQANKLKMKIAPTGIGRFQTQINNAAILMGGNVRVGIEDSIYYGCPDKKLDINQNLIERIVRLSHELGREIATAD